MHHCFYAKWRSITHEYITEHIFKDKLTVTFFHLVKNRVPLLENQNRCFLVGKSYIHKIKRHRKIQYLRSGGNSETMLY